MEITEFKFKPIYNSRKSTDRPLNGQGSGSWQSIYEIVSGNQSAAKFDARGSAIATKTTTRPVDL